MNMHRDEYETGASTMRSNALPVLLRRWTAAALLIAAGSASTDLGAFETFSTATATQPTPPVFNLLSWQPAVPSEGEPDIIAYNVYRKLDLNAPYPQFPLNPAPLEVMSDCNAIKALMPEGSADWDATEKALNGGKLFLNKLYLTPLVLQKKKQEEDTAGIAEGIGPPPPPRREKSIHNAPDVSIAQNPVPKQLDPCDAHTLAKTSAAIQRVLVLARTRWKVAVLLGLAYRDTQVLQGTTYYYEIRGLDGQGGEFVLDTDVAIQAGVLVPVSQPQDIHADAGDSRVLLYWEGASEAAGFNVYRAISGSNAYQLVNPASLTAKVTQDLDGQFIKQDESPVDGFVDFQHWSTGGSPISHKVEGQWISGPTDGVAYDYEVAGVDLLGFEGTFSDLVSATPMDTTAPAVAKELKAIPDDTTSQIEIRWAKVSKDVDGHREKKIVGYRVYRRDTPVVNPVGNVQLISPLLPQPGKGVTMLSFLDIHNPITNPLRPPFGEQVFWYHVESEDESGNLSALTVGVSAHLKDITAPASPLGVEAEGFEDRIRVKWDLVSELDPLGKETISGYYIYRSLCNLGVWACVNSPKGERCDTSFELIGYVSQEDALLSVAGPFFDDTTVPEESPLCYAYLVKSVDKAQNRSGTMPPDPFQEIIVCAKLRDKTPPEPAIVSSLLARDQAVLVEWIGPPVQDVKAYHVYRSLQEDSGYQFVGGKTVEIPPNQPKVLTEPYDPQLTGCATIPLEIHEDMSVGEFLDKSADPKRIYYYKVVGVDQEGNEASLSKAIGVSTFTYSTAQPSAPSAVVAPQVAPCALVLSWTSSLPGNELEGYAVFRSTTPVGSFLQLDGVLYQNNQYVDRKILRGKTYYYRVAVVKTDGKMTLSNVVSGMVN